MLSIFSFNRYFYFSLTEFVSINNEWQIIALGDCYKIVLSELIDLLVGDYSYDKFKQQYFENYKGNQTGNLSSNL